jgi:cytochrome oxidase Cu insertion factor (SCO1/SenC/PrrC family)
MSIAVSGLIFVLASNLFKPGNKVGDIALDISLRSVNGTEFRLSNNRGKVIILDFMTTTCPYCIEEFKAIGKLDSNEIRVISINLDGTDDEALNSFANSNGVTWFIGSSMQSGSNYQVSAVPTIIIVDKEGIIRYRGYYTTTEELIQVIGRSS